MSSPAPVDPFRFCSPLAGVDDPEQRHAMISTAAYFRAQARGFMPGHELEDWIAAEADIDASVADISVT